MCLFVLLQEEYCGKEVKNGQMWLIILGISQLATKISF